MAKRQKELDEKERKERDEKERKERKEWDEKEAGYDGDSDGDYESEEEQTLPYETPAKLQSLVTFDMKDAMTKPIKWTSPNGSPHSLFFERSTDRLEMSTTSHMSSRQTRQ
jgi:hypothetical protein